MLWLKIVWTDSKFCITGTQIWFLLPLYNPDYIYLEKSPKKTVH